MYLLGTWSFCTRLGGTMPACAATHLAPARRQSRSFGLGLGLGASTVHLTKPHLILFESGADTGYWIQIMGNWVWAITSAQPNALGTVQTGIVMVHRTVTTTPSNGFPKSAINSAPLGLF